MMKRTAIILSLAALAAVSCEKPQDCCPGEQDQTQQEEKARVSMSVESGFRTKATSSSDASVSTAAGNIQVLAFSTDGKLLAYGRNTSGSGNVSMELPLRELEFQAVVNCPYDLSGVSTKSALLGKTSNLKDNTPSKIQMRGSLRKTITGSTSLSIPVDRLAARVDLESITAAFTSDAHKAMDFTVDDIFLENVVGSCTLGGTALTGGTWYNRMKLEGGEADHLLHDVVGRKIQTGGRATPYSTVHSFWCYPNPSADSQSGSWGARYTRLTVKATLGGTVYWYPINIPSPQANTLYKVTNLKITGPGSDSPDRPVTKGTVSFSITVSPWEPGFSQNVEY